MPWAAEARPIGTTRTLVLLTLGVLGLIAVLAWSGRLLGGPGATAEPAAIAVALPVAFLGGLLALLSPCSGAIVPAFFAFGLQSKGSLLRLTYVFFLGLALVFVPLGFATSLLAGLFLDHAETIWIVGGLFLVFLGTTTLLRIDLAGSLLAAVSGRVQTGASDAANRVGTETARVFAFGVVFGFATSSCTAPILGAMATLALASGFASLEAMILFLVFALGIAAPLFVLAAVFERYDLARRGFLRPRTVHVLGRDFLVHDLATGVVLVALGLVFLAFRGTLSLTATYDAFGATEAYGRATHALSAAFAGVPAWASAAATAAFLALAAFFLRRFARSSAPAQKNRDAEGDGENDERNDGRNGSRTPGGPGRP